MAHGPRTWRRTRRPPPCRGTTAARHPALVGLLLGVALVGCSAAPPAADSRPGAADPPPGEAAPTTAAPPPTAGAQVTSPTSPAVAATAAATGAPGGFRTTTVEGEVELEARHPGGAVLRVHRIRVDPAAITLQVEVVNGATTTAALNSSLSGNYLVDDLGNAYRFSPPEDNPSLAVESGATLTGSWVFLGPLPADARSLRLLVNVSGPEATVGPDQDTGPMGTGLPRFQLDGIPVPT